MLCKNCGTQNIEGAVKCVQCGQVLDLIHNNYNQMPVIQQSINSWLIPAIITNACCCMPLGIISVYFAAKANTYTEKGDFLNAKASADKAKLWSIIGIALGLVIWVGYVIIMFISGLSEGFLRAKM